MRSRRRHRALAVAAIVASAAAGGCGDPELEGEATTGRSERATSTSGPSGTGVEGTPAAPDAGFDTTQQSTPPARYGLLREVGAARQPDGTERVVFEFEGDVPGYRIGYVDRPLREDGSGNEVSVDGGAVLGVHFEPASGVDLTGSEMRVVFRGPNRLDLATTTIVDVARVSDFEANLDWAIGLDSKVAFKVSTLADPGRIVVDVAPSPGA